MVMSSSIVLSRLRRIAEMTGFYPGRMGGTKVEEGSCSPLLSSEIGRILTPQVCVPLSHCALTQPIFCQPVFGAMDHGKERCVARGVFELGFALAVVNPGDRIAGVGIDR